MDLVTLALAKKYVDKVSTDVSENIAEQLEDQLLPEVSSEDNNKIIIVENGKWKLVSANRFQSNPITVSINAYPNSAEFGVSVKEIDLTWSTNLPPIYLKVSGPEIKKEDEVISDLSTTSKEISSKEGFTSRQTWTITVKDESGNTASKSAALNFYNRNWYGAAEMPEKIDSDFIKTLTKTGLTGGKTSKINVTAGPGQYVWYAQPTRHGTCQFQAGALPGGFKLTENSPIQFENEQGYIEPYYVYHSENDDLGSVQVVIT